VSLRTAVRAPAKVNLSLRVLRRRTDGYHDLDTLFQAIDLYDEVEVELVGGGVSLSVERAADLGPEESNLAHRAASAFIEAAGAETGVRVRLTKHIPVGAGLGGGSSDAAAVLRCLSALIPGVGASRLAEIGAVLGSDVPFFLGESPLARGRGRGELLQPLDPLPPTDLVLVSPPVRVSTAEAYRALADNRAAGMERPDPVAAPVATSWNDPTAVSINDFEPLMAASHPEIAGALASLLSVGASLARMTGSGSTCFGLFDDREAAERAAEALAEETGWPCVAARTLEAFPPVRVVERA